MLDHLCSQSRQTRPPWLTKAIYDHTCSYLRRRRCKEQRGKLAEGLSSVIILFNWDDGQLIALLPLYEFGFLFVDKTKLEGHSREMCLMMAKYESRNFDYSAANNDFVLHVNKKRSLYRNLPLLFVFPTMLG